VSAHRAARAGVLIVVVAAGAGAARPARAELHAPPRLVLRLAAADEPTVVVPGQPAASPAGPNLRPAVEAPRPSPVDPDAGLGGKQVGMGFLALLGGGALGSGLFYLADREDSPTLVYASLGVGALLPAAVGMAVCGVGTTSKVYDGRCFPTVGGAYIGALGVLPGALVGLLLGCSSGSSSTPSSGDGQTGLQGLDDCAVGAAVGAALGLTIGTLVGAYNGWRIFKRPKPGTLRASLL
jgi:hypothetical protein